jgi:hypothetical protein
MLKQIGGLTNNKPRKQSVTGSQMVFVPVLLIQGMHQRRQLWLEIPVQPSNEGADATAMFSAQAAM